MTTPIDRPDFRVVARILEALGKSGRPLRPTQLQQASGTNYSQLQRYLELLRARGLVEDAAGGASEGPLLKLSPKGHEAHRFLVGMLAELIPPRPPR